MKLYALKCRDGYLRLAPDESFTLVKLDKASVYPSEKKSRLIDFVQQHQEIEALRLVELILTEIDLYHS